MAVIPNAIFASKLAEFLSANNFKICIDDEAANNGTEPKKYDGCRDEVVTEVKKVIAGFRRKLAAFAGENASDVTTTSATTAEQTSTINTDAALELVKNYAASFEVNSDEGERLMWLKFEKEMENINMLRKELSERKDSFFKEKIEQLQREKNVLEVQLKYEREGRREENNKWNEEKQVLLKERETLLQFLEAMKQCSNFVEGETAEVGVETDLVASHVRKMLSKCDNEKEAVLRIIKEEKAENKEDRVSMGSCQQTLASISSHLPPPILELDESMDEGDEDICDAVEKPAFVSNKTTPKLRPRRLRHRKSSTGSRMCVCGMKFKTVDIMKAHLKLYSNHWKFVCVSCSERFFSLAHLKRHMINGHGVINPLSEYQVGCRMCGKMFRSWTSFHMHRITVHGSQRQPRNVCHEHEEKKDLAYSARDERNCSDDDDYSDMPILKNEMEY